MRIVCPSCSAAYFVPDAMLVGRRAVRCASCANEFEPIEAEAAAQPAPDPEAARVLRLQADADADGAEADGAEADDAEAHDAEARGAAADDGAPPIPRQALRAAPSAIDRLMRSPAKVKHRGGPTLWMAWIVSVAAVLALVWVAYAWRDPIMDAWPPSMRLYAALGLTAAP